MKKLFSYADSYILQSDWKDLALLKFCLFAMGVITAFLVPEKHRKPMFLACIGVFAATYIPLMRKFFGIVREMNE